MIFATSNALDDIAIKHTADSVKSLINLTLDRAVVLNSDDSGRLVQITDLVDG
ncbi:hypothetical protein [Mycobacterium uberis]|uniref:hypothetical protein n=1 Tax=Mycobacterium uberis TaxID=2162698 RepID=UPI0024365CF4|nr:hypothetical protein [Mycobacterium uberis]